MRPATTGERDPSPGRSAWLRRMDATDRAIASFMRRVGTRLLRFSLAIVFVWFGALKVVGISPAEDLVRATVPWLPGDLFVPFLGAWEVAIGVCLAWRPTIRVALALLALQMPGTMLPLFVLPDVTFRTIPFGLTMEGQYVIKNLTLVAAALVIGGTARSGSREDDRLN